VAPPPVVRRLFEVNSEPHTGARPSVRLCVGLIISCRPSQRFAELRARGRWFLVMLLLVMRNHIVFSVLKARSIRWCTDISAIT
jgi:hypothetical protein